MALTLIAIISITPAFAETMAIEVEGLMKCLIMQFPIRAQELRLNLYQQILKSIALIFQVLVSESESEGDISITFDREIFDAKYWRGR